MIDLTKFLFETLRQDGTFALCRGRRDDGELPNILLLAPASEYQTLGSFERLEHERALRDELGSDWAARPLTLVRHEGRTMLMLEDPGGVPLDRLLGEPMELSRFLRFAVGLASALGKLHKRGLIHKDIKPANILVDSAAGAVWLTGFGIASRLPRERQSPEPPEVIAGTLAYMAPEQTGRMNRSIDSRSDLYSLGVTFYEMLTGVLPFNASDPMEWVHCHVARQPPRLTERLEPIPEPISAIVSKLLAKTAEERYQTAAGLQADLTKCLAEWQSLGNIEPFLLGKHDVPDRLLTPEKLYGRYSVCKALLAAFDRVITSGIPELVLVSGYSGIGKSSVVNELHKVIVPPRGIFISGKFDQHKRDIPYATLGQAFQGLVRQILSKSEKEVAYWRDAIREAVGTNGQLMVNLIPELELVIGKQPPVPEIPPQEAEVRFDAVLPRFLGAFARKKHPLVLFLDDLQWLDPATLQLLGRLVAHPDIRHLLLIGAYRDNEVSAYHPLVLTLEAIRKTGPIVHEIVLQPLSLADVTQLFSDALRCDLAHAHPLAELVHEKTAGNPFFAIQFLTTLAEERLLVFDASEMGWTWDVNSIRGKGFTDNVVDLMISKLKRLPAATQEALKQLACIGNSAETRVLSMVRGESEEEVHMDLWEAVRDGLVLRLGSSYKFLHDRVDEAAYALIPEEFCPQMHLRIARLLVAKMTRDEIAEEIFDVVHQFHSGLALISDPDEKEQVAELNLNAGIKAKASTAYASACTYLSAGMDLVGYDPWKNRYELAFGLWLERAECEYLNGDFDEAERLIAELLSRAVSKVDKAAAYRLKVLLHILRAEYQEAVESGLECARLFGIEMPAHPTREQVQVEYETIWQNLGERSIENLIDLPPMTDPEKQAAMRVLAEIRAPANMTDVKLHDLVTFHMVNATLKYGTTDASTHGIVGLATILGPVFQRYIDGYHFGKLSCALVEKYGFHAYKAKAYLGMEHLLLWIQPISKAIEFTRLAFHAAVETGDLSFASYSCEHLVTDLLLQGVHLDDVWRESQMGLEFHRTVKFRDVADMIVSQQRFIQNMRGQTAAFSTFSDAHFDEERFEAQLTSDRMTRMVCYYWTLKLEARFMSGDYDAARAAAQKAKSLLPSARIHVQLVDYYYYNALTIAAMHETPGLRKQAERFEELKQSLERLREWSESCPETFLDKYTLVLAELARIEHRDLDAMPLYEKAIRAAREHGFVHYEGIGNELAARFYLDRSHQTTAYAYLREARHCYLRWGALGKVKQLEQRYPAIAEQESGRPATTIGTSVEQLDLETVMKASQAVSGEIVLEKLIETLMVIAVEHAGAERGLLILPLGDDYRIEAEARTGRDRVGIYLRQRIVTPSELPESLLRYVIRTHESVILDDASSSSLFSEDPYVLQSRPRSVLCLPLIKQTKLVGVLYLENNLAPRVFTPERLAMLELLASQAAISLDHARLYADRGRLNAELTKVNSDRRKAVESLRASEERWRKLFENSSAGIVLTTPDGRYIAANVAFQKMLGYTEEELQKLTVVELTHKEDRAATNAILAESAEGQRRNYRIEKRYRRKDGSVIWADVSAVFVPFSESAPAFFAGVLVDITERKRAEEDLHRSEAFLAQGQKISRTGSWGWHVSTGEVYWSKEHFRIFNYDPETAKPSYSLFMERVHPEDRPLFEQILERAVREKGDFEHNYRIILGDGSIKFIRSGGQSFVTQSGDLEFIGTVMDITELKRSEEMQVAIAREREMFAQQRATQLARANEALRESLDVLASVPELDEFLGQVMAAITGQLGAVSSTLRLCNIEKNILSLAFVFEDGRVMSPDEARYPVAWQSWALDDKRFNNCFDQPVTVQRVADPEAIVSEDKRAYLLALGVKTVLVIPLISRGQAVGRLTFRFTDERDFSPEELEIAQALATQASLAIHLTRLAETGRRAAVLEERNRLSGEIHDSLAQTFAAIAIQLNVARDVIQTKEGDGLGYLAKAKDLARFGQAEAHRSALGLDPLTLPRIQLTEAMRMLVERSNIPGRVQCNLYCSDSLPNDLPPEAQHNLLRIAQEAISNALRHANPTTISVSLQCDHGNLELEVRDNGDGIPDAELQNKSGLGLINMRKRAKMIEATFDLRTELGQGTAIVVRLPIHK